MLNTNLDSKVLIVGGGPVGLFTALQLCQLNVPVRIIEESPGNDRPFADIQPTSLPTLLSCSIPARDCPGTILLLSPRALQLLQSLNLYDDAVASGVKHWQLQIHTSSTTATAAATSTSASSPTTPPMSPILESAASLDTIHSYKLWENKATDQNFCLSIERSKLCHLLEDALTRRHGIQVDYDCELVDVRHGGGVENIVYMENELDSDFYLGNNQLLADATTPITCSTSSTKAKTESSPVMVTIKQQENQHNQQRMRICQTQYVVVTCGKSSLMRQRLAGVACEGRQNLPIQRKASAISTTSNKKIADTINEGRYFYSMVAKVETDYPGIKPVSIVAKPEGTLIILVHNNYASMMIQQNKATVNDDDKGPMSLTKAQKVIQQLLQPYEIRFLEINDYCYWKDPRCYTRIDTAPDCRYTRSITLGNASLDVWPNGWILPDMGFEQAVNLCWKLDLDIRQRSMPQLLDTYHEETQIKKKDASMASDVLLRLLSDPFAITQGGGMTKLLQGHRHCFIGGMLLENNELNMDCPQTRKVQRGSVGTLAPNGRLKPYNLNQLLTQQTRNHHRATSLAPNIKADKKPNQQSITSLASNSDNSNYQSDTNISSTNKLKFLRSLFTFPHNKKNQPAPVAITGTTTPSTALASATTSDKWKGIRANHYHLWDQLPSHTGDTNLQQSTFTILVLCGSLLDSNSLLALRRLKKHLDQPNSFLRMFEYPQHQYSHHQQQQKHHHQQQQQQQQQKMTRSKSTPTDSSRSTLSDTVETSPAPPQSKLRQTQQPRRSESSSSFYSVRSNSSSTDESISNDSNPQHYRDSINTNLQSHRSSLFTRFSSSSNTDRYSMATTISNSSTASNSLPPPPPLPSVPPLPSGLDNQYSASPSSLHTSTSEPATPPPPPPSSSSMFSFVCLTTSSKSECSQFLSEQTPYSLHQLFPFGLSKTFLDHDQQCHQSYAIKDQQHPLPTLVVIRRDGYVGARIDIRDQPLYELDRYFDRILLPVVDFSSAAALVADDYCL